MNEVVGSYAAKMVELFYRLYYCALLIVIHSQECVQIRPRIAVVLTNYIESVIEWVRGIAGKKIN